MPAREERVLYAAPFAFVAPFLIQGRRKIAAVFGVQSAVVTEWVKEGAPLWAVGHKWQADYHSLLYWLENNKKISLLHDPD